jgi:hypothetical protein
MRKAAKVGIIVVGAIAALFIATGVNSAANAQTTNAGEADQMRLAMNQNAFENKTIIDDAESLNANNSGPTISHRWSEIAMVPAGQSENMTVLCGNGSYPTGGGFMFGSPDLQAVSSHAVVTQNGSMGWTATAKNTNATMPLPAAADVLCRSEVAITTPTTEPDASTTPAPAEPEQNQ